ncbi:hypothetical protein V8E53_010016 [Lactarius tabidus]
MPPHTRRTQQRGDSTQGPSDKNSFHSPVPSSTSGQSNSVCPSSINTAFPNPRVQTPNRLKRTLTQTDTSVSLSPVIPTDTAKRAQTIGPTHDRAMLLELARENEIVYSPNKPWDNTASSYYPGRSDDTHAIAHLNAQLDPDIHDADADDYVIETEEDWMGDDQFTRGLLSKFSESVAAERPLWQGIGNATASGSSNMIRSTHIESTEVSSGASASGHASIDTIQDMTTPASALVLLSQSGETTAVTPGSTKLMLTLQRLLICTIIQDVFEHMHAYLVFTNAFPNLKIMLIFAHDSLVAAAEGHQPEANAICEQFRQDEEYFNKVVPLPCARICRFCSEVKDRCNAVSMAAFHALGSAADIACNVLIQLSNYTYTFPLAAVANSPQVIPKRTQPYRNDRIISVIQELYFTGGSGSFASRFDGWFPTYQGPNGDTCQEVPILMLALVATALYATIREWHTGEQKVMEFSANAYLDVYFGHVNTLNHIAEQWEGAYHVMMADIYARASITAGLRDPISNGVPVADLDLQALEG